MNANTQIEIAPATAWQKFYRWAHALDEAFHFDPLAQTQTSVQQLTERVRLLETAVRHFETSAISHTEDRTRPHGLLTESGADR